MSALKGTIQVHYTCRDDWHVFRSDELPGLFVAHQDRKTAFDDVATSIAKLFHLALGTPVLVQPQLTFDEFVSAFETGAGAQGPPGWPYTRQFSIERATA